MEDEPETPWSHLAACSHMFPSTSDLLLLLKWNLKQTVEYIKGHLQRTDFLLRAAATPKLRASPRTPGVTVTVSSSKGAVRRITTALKNIKSSADPISWGEIWRRISLVWSSDVCLLTPKLIDTEIAAHRGAGSLHPSLWLWLVRSIPNFPSRRFFFKAQAKPSVFAFSVVTLVNAHRERPCEGFSGFSLSWMRW